MRAQSLVTIYLFDKCLEIYLPIIYSVKIIL